MHFSEFPCFSLHFSAFLCISLHFFAFLCISLDSIAVSLFTIFHYYHYRVSLKKRSLRDWHPKKWFQGQPVKICRCKFFFWWFPKQSVAHAHAKHCKILSACDLGFGVVVMRHAFSQKSFFLHFWSSFI